MFFIANYYSDDYYGYCVIFNIFCLSCVAVVMFAMLVKAW